MELRGWKLVIIIFGLSPYLLCAATLAPSVEAWGWDDNNISTLNPYVNGTAQYVAKCDWLSAAIKSSATTDNPNWDFTDSAKWTFRFAFDTPPDHINGPDTVQPFVYTAWVVHNDGYGLPDGTFKRPRPADGDVGGANFTLLYTPKENGDPSLQKMHFLQIVRTITTYGDPATEQPTSAVTRYFLDNAGNTTTPFYDLAGGYSGTVKDASGNLTGKYLQDSPYRCEPEGAQPNCMQDNIRPLLSIDWEAQTFVAVDLGRNDEWGTNNDVVLYGGRWWGFTYTNTDTPEPALGILGGLVLFGMAVLDRRPLNRPPIRPHSAS